MVQCNRRALADRISHEQNKKKLALAMKIVDKLTADLDLALLHNSHREDRGHDPLDAENIGRAVG